MKKINISTKKYPNTFALVDDEDYEYLNQWKWTAIKGNSGLYAVRCNYKKGKILSQIIMQRNIMGTPKGMHTDHINHNTLDNRKNNLRICKSGDNIRNQKKRILKKKSTSKYKGVSYRKETKVWRARICFNYKIITIGEFKSQIEAAKVYDQAAKKYYGEFAYLNFPEKKCS